MVDPIRRHAQARPETPALHEGDATWTYATLDATVDATADRLRGRGLAEGARIAIRMRRGAPYVILLWALWRAGYVAVPLSTRLPDSAVAAHLQQVGAVALITDADSLGDALPGDSAVIRSEEVFADPGQASGAVPSQSYFLRPDQPISIILTSGTTGCPKAVLHTWRNHLFSAKGANANIRLRPGDRWGLSLPLYHVGGLAILMRCALAGASVTIMEPSTPISEGVHETQATHLSLVATQFRRLLEDTSGGPPSFLRAVLLGGGPIPAGLLDEGYERGWPLHTSYGCTEMASQITTTDSGAPRHALSTAGRPLPHRQVRVAADGQIWVRGAPLSRGYVEGDAVQDPTDENGWYPTGDRGRFDAKGRLQVLGRVDRMFVSGGENIQPEEIEHHLERLDRVNQAVVVPVPDSEFGHRPVAFVRQEGGEPLDTLQSALADVLPRYKRPDAFHSLPDAAVEDQLKLDYDALKERARSLHAPTEGTEQNP